MMEISIVAEKMNTAAEYLKKGKASYSTLENNMQDALLDNIKTSYEG